MHVGMAERSYSLDPSWSAEFVFAETWTQSATWVSRHCSPRTLGLGRIQVVPTVNVGYDHRTEEAKDLRGRVEDYVNMTSGALQTEQVQWQESPLSLVKCMAQFHEPHWVPST